MSHPDPATPPPTSHSPAPAASSTSNLPDHDRQGAAADPDAPVGWLARLKSHIVTSHDNARIKQVNEENERYLASLKLPPHENQAAKERAQAACARQFLDMYECKQNATFFETRCFDLADAYYRCYRKHRGFVRSNIMGVDINLSRILGPDPVESVSVAERTRNETVHILSQALELQEVKMMEGEGAVQDEIRRNRPGTLSADMYAWSNMLLDDMNTTLALEQYLQQTIRSDPANIEAIITRPESADESIWQYEHLRQFCLELGDLTTALLPECTHDSCPKMKATDEFEYLCASHNATPNECDAISYITHTLDAACALLNSEKHFPSRVSIQKASIKHISSTARRIYRIFAHAYFHHRSIFDDFEAQQHLCARFHAFVLANELVTPDLLIVPLPKADAAE